MTDNLRENLRQFRIEHDFRIAEGFVVKEEGKILSSNDFTDEAKKKLDDIDFATEDDVIQMLNSIF